MDFGEDLAHGEAVVGEWVFGFWRGMDAVGFGYGWDGEWVDEFLEAVDTEGAVHGIVRGRGGGICHAGHGVVVRRGGLLGLEDADFGCG